MFLFYLIFSGTKPSKKRKMLGPPMLPSQDTNTLQVSRSDPTLKREYGVILTHFLGRF
jgi:hypothetical protein